MVLRRDGDAVIAIGQPAHAWVSGQMARAWGNADFGVPDPWEEVCLAAEQHDAGMADWDAAPAFNAETGLPQSFMEMPLDVHAELWASAWERVLPQSRYAALLASMHGSSLYEMRDPDKLNADDAAIVCDFLDGQRAVQERLVAGLRADPATAVSASDEALARNRRLIWIWDAFSLALCLDWAPHTLRGVPAAGVSRVDVDLTPGADERTVVVDPWPFGGSSVRVRCEGRQLAGRFADEAEMRAALDAAEWVTLEWELVPAAALNNEQ